MSLSAIFAQVNQSTKTVQKPAPFQSDVTEEEALSIVQDMCGSRRYATRLILTVGFGDWERDTWVSNLQKKIGKLEVCSADDYFMKNGKYKFDSTNLKWAHQQCQGKVCTALMNKKVVLVANTNLYTDHINMYNKMKEDFIIVQFIPKSFKSAIAMGQNNSKNIPESAFKKGYLAMKNMDIHPEVVPRMSALLRIAVGEEVGEDEEVEEVE
tara:strand:- start:71 stop:703 length:633 start_codon:yes stop_codon:yes gene_type:complete